jgi:hypothetical protein
MLNKPADDAEKFIVNVIREGLLLGRIHSEEGLLVMDPPQSKVCVLRRSLHAAVLCCAVLCCAVLCCAVLCCAVLCCAVLCCAVLCCAVLVSTMVLCPVLCCGFPVRVSLLSLRAPCL